MTPEERIAHLEWVIAGMVAPTEDALPGLSLSQSRIYAFMDRHRGKRVASERILTALYHDRNVDDWPESARNLLAVQIHRINSKLGARVIRGFVGSPGGYFMEMK
jgi:DNA-binding response OmpR family regulator